MRAFDKGEVGLADRRPQPGTVWNRLTPQEEETILRQALQHDGAVDQVVQRVVEWTRMEQLPVENRSRFLSDRGPGFLVRALEECLRMLQIRHVYCSPYHPQTHGKRERLHETLKARLKLLVFTSRGLCEPPWRSSSSFAATGAITKGSAM
jgi:hypothetical protein